MAAMPTPRLLTSLGAYIASGVWMVRAVGVKKKCKSKPRGRQMCGGRQYGIAVAPMEAQSGDAAGAAAAQRGTLRVTPRLDATTSPLSR
jgi:hypothetical protein